MKYANGNARIASVTVTSAASTTVRQMIRKYVAVMMSRKFWSVSWWCRLFVNGSTLHSAVINIAPSDAR